MSYEKTVLKLKLTETNALYDMGDTLEWVNKHIITIGSGFLKEGNVFNGSIIQGFGLGHGIGPGSGTGNGEGGSATDYSAKKPELLYMPLEAKVEECHG